MKENKYILTLKEGEQLARLPGDLNGKDFLIDSLKDCVVHVLDHTAQIQVDDCENCTIVIGPVAGPAIFRDCKNCRVSVACQQLRTRDCKNITFGVYCSTNPSIEDSTDLVFQPFDVAYPKLSEHFAAAELDPLASTWDRIYDFTPREGSPNYKVVIPDDFAFQEIPLSPELGPCECPVPGPSGQRYGAADAAELQQSDIQGQPMSANEEGHLEPVEGFGNFDAALAQGGDDFTGFEDAQPAQADPAAFGQSEEEDAAPEQVDPAFEDFGAPADAGAYDRDGGVIALGAGEDAGAGSMDMLGMGMGEAPEEDGRGHFADASGEHFAEPFAEPAPEGAAFGAGGMANGFEVEDNAYVPPAAQQVETEAEEPQQFSFLAELEVRERQERLDALDSERERRGKTREEARGWIDAYMKERTAKLEARYKTNRDEMNTEKALAEELQQEGNFWEGVLGMVDQKKQTSVNGADVARMKGLLTTARNSKLPVA